MSLSRLYLGVDGGGSKTEFVVVDETGSPRARASAGGSYHLQIGLEGVEAVLRQGIEAVCRQLSVAPRDLAFTFFGLPAYGEDKAADAQLAALASRMVADGPHACGNDMVCAWAGSLGGEDGINIVSGTGSIGYGERQGVCARTGGWSELFSDEGSAYWIAVRGLNAFTRMSDGRVPRGPLHGLVVEALSLQDDLDVCAKIMGPPAMPRDALASLAPIVAEAAQQGDATAAGILAEAGRELAALATSLRRRLGFGTGELAPVSWSGGVLTRMPPVALAFQDALGAHGGFLPVAPRMSPALGAALYALRRAGGQGARPSFRGATVPAVGD